MARRGITSFLTHVAPPADGGPATLAQALDARVREGALVEPLEGGGRGGRRGALLRLRAPLPGEARSPRHLQGPLQ